MRVSVVVPNYNYAAYLRERLRSVLNQTCRDLELLYIDDASTDASNRIAEAFARTDPRMQMMVRKANSGGPYWTWNEAAASARGDWLWFAGADDTASPAFLEEMLKVADRCPGVGVVRSDFFRMNSTGRIIDRGSDDRVRRWRDGADYEQSGAREISYAALSAYATASALLIRRDVFVACGGFDPRIPLAADTLLYVKAVSMTGTSYRARPLASYRDHSGSVTRSGDAAATEISKCFCMAHAIAILEGKGNSTETERRTLERYVRFRLNSARCSSGGRVAEQVRWMVPFILENVSGIHASGWLRGGS